MLVPHPVPPAAFDVLPVALGRLEVVVIVRLDAIELSHGLGLQLHRPGREVLVCSGLQPLIHILPCAFQGGAFRVLLLNVLDKVLRMFPICLIGVERENFILLRSVGHGLRLALSKGLHSRQPVIGLLVEILNIRLVAPAHTALPLSSLSTAEFLYAVFVCSSKAASCPLPSEPWHWAHTLFCVLCVTNQGSLPTLF